MNKLRSITVSVFVLILSNQLLSEVTNGIDLLPYIGINPGVGRDGRSTGVGDVQLFVTFVNRTEKDVCLATNLKESHLGVVTLTSTGRPQTEIRCDFGLVPWVYDARIVPSYSELMPVKLAAGEAAGFIVKIAVPAGTQLEDMIYVYTVDKSVGGKYGLWWGTAKARLVQQVPKYKRQATDIGPSRDVK